ncbi:MAG: metal-dependent transcriptional regulator [Verrucomicrobia bacterium]|nr:metal-dependent transcriptional regulator [Verrucomicrobiota bacterium]
MHPPIGKLTEHQEMYIKAIYVLGEKHKVARVKDIAKYLGVTKSSVSSALKHLAEKALILYDPYSYATLTKKGKSLAEELVNKYGVLSDFMTDILAVPEDLADENACRMEHVVDDFVMERLIQFLKFFKSCDVTFNVAKTGPSISAGAIRKTAATKTSQPRATAARKAS